MNQPLLITLDQAAEALSSSYRHCLLTAGSRRVVRYWEVRRSWTCATPGVGRVENLHSFRGAGLLQTVAAPC